MSFRESVKSLVKVADETVQLDDLLGRAADTDDVALDLRLEEWLALHVRGKICELLLGEGRLGLLDVAILAFDAEYGQRSPQSRALRKWLTVRVRLWRWRCRRDRGCTPSCLQWDCLKRVQSSEADGRGVPSKVLISWKAARSDLCLRYPSEGLVTPS